MFSLIITIISIALVAALAIATLYYGGSAFSQGSAKAIADTVIAQAQQITGANTLYANDNGGSYATNLTTLSGNNYLSVIPVAPLGAFAAGASAANAYTITSSTVNTVNNTLGNANVCLAVNRAAGTATAAATAPNAASTSTAQFDCYANGGNFTFLFKG